MSFSTGYLVGATSKIINVKAITISTGLPYTAGAYNTATISATYKRDGAAATTITLVTATAGAYTSSGFVHAGKGVYEIGAPTAALASGADGVTFQVDGIADVLFSATRVELLGTDPRSTSPLGVDVVSISGDTTAADNAELFFDGTGYAGGTTKLQVNAVQVGSQTASAAGTVTFPGTVASTTNITAAAGCAVSSIGSGVITATSIASDALTAAKIASDVTTELQSGLATASALSTVSGKIDTIDDFLDTEIAAIKAKTDSLTFTQAGHVDANIQRINDVAITGDGSGTPFNV